MILSEASKVKWWAVSGCKRVLKINSSNISSDPESLLGKEKIICRVYYLQASKDKGMFSSFLCTTTSCKKDRSGFWEMACGRTKTTTRLQFCICTCVLAFAFSSVFVFVTNFCIPLFVFLCFFVFERQLAVGNSRQPGCGQKRMPQMSLRKKRSGRLTTGW